MTRATKQLYSKTQIRMIEIAFLGTAIPFGIFYGLVTYNLFSWIRGMIP